jgi:hypothetical protein
MIASSRSEDRQHLDQVASFSGSFSWPEEPPLPIPIVVLAIFLGGTTIELLWSHGIVVALLGAPVGASVGTVVVILLSLSWRALRGLNLINRPRDFLDLRTSPMNGPADGPARTP